MLSVQYNIYFSNDESGQLYYRLSRWKAIPVSEKERELLLTEIDNLSKRMTYIVWGVVFTLVTGIFVAEFAFQGIPYINGSIIGFVTALFMAGVSIFMYRKSIKSVVGDRKPIRLKLEERKLRALQLRGINLRWLSVILFISFLLAASNIFRLFSTNETPNYLILVPSTFMFFTALYFLFHKVRYNRSDKDGTSQ